MKEKIIGTFVGFVRSLEFVRSAFQDGQNGHHSTFVAHDADNTIRFLAYSLEKRNVVINKVQEYLSNVTDQQQIHKILLKHAAECVKQGYVLNNSDKIQGIRQEAEAFINDLNNNLYSWRIFIPVQGLHVQTSFQVGRCTVHPFKDSPNFRPRLENPTLEKWTQEQFVKPSIIPSELSDVLEELNQDPYSVYGKKFGDDIRAVTDSYLIYATSTQVDKDLAEENALNEASLALHLLHLFQSSNFSHEYNRNMKRRFGIVGMVNSEGVKRLVSLRTDIEGLQNQLISPVSSTIPNQAISVTQNDIYSMQHAGLENLNQRIANLDMGPNQQDEVQQTTERILRAITWFSKGTTSLKIADSFLMYAIAIECLFSEGRTAEKKYAEYVATLTSNHNLNSNTPLEWRLVSKSFSEKLGDTTNIQVTIKERFNELFKIRNKIAHGAIFDHTVDALDLLDFETLVKNAILAFIVGNWDTLANFKKVKNEQSLNPSEK